MLVLVPLGLIFTAVAWVWVSRNPESALTFALLQLLLMLVFVTNFVRNFSKRQRLLTECAEDAEIPPS